MPKLRLAMTMKKLTLLYEGVVLLYDNATLHKSNPVKIVIGS